MKDITPENFDELITNKEGWVLVDFWGPGCTACTSLGHVLQRIEDKGTEVSIVKLNVQKYNRIAWAFDVYAAPALVLFHNGIVKAVSEGYRPEESLCAWLEENMNE